MMNRGRFRTPNPEVVRTSTVLFDSTAQVDELRRAYEAGDRTVTLYGTYGTPTTKALSDLLLDYEGGAHVAFGPSGLAAITIALFATVKTGDHLLVTDSVYQPARDLCDNLLAQLGVETEYYDPLIGGGIADLIRPNTAAIWLESPGSHTFEIQDVPAITAAAREASERLGRHVVTIIDNTYGSPGLLSPFLLGIDISVIALTKYWGGHSDLLMGAVVANEATRVPVEQTAHRLGMCVGADDAWLVVRGARTVAARLPIHEAQALELATRLSMHPRVGRVLHPALPDCPGHEIWERDFDGSNGLFSFELLNAEGGPATPEEARAFVDRLIGLGRFAFGYSWGGFESLVVPVWISRKVRQWTGGALIRLHIGLEPSDELWDDLQQALDAG